MPLVKGPDTYELDESGIIKVWVPQSEDFPGHKLGEVLSAYSEKYGSTFEPYDGSDPNFPFANNEPAKYFWFNGVTMPSKDFERRPVDIHIIRNGKSICPKQDLTFSLLPSDTVEIGVLRAC